MANHLLIGLGGTGGKVLREMRKRVYEEFRSNDPKCNVNLGYLYVDSSPADLNDKTDWKTLGKSVHLAEAEKVSIHGIAANMFDNIQMYPGLEAFLSPNDVKLTKTYLGPLVTAGIGGQRRRLGRALLANNMSVNGENNFVTRLKLAVNSLTKNGDAEITFHVCAGLAGGTGSGSVIDVISQIRHTYDPTHSGQKYSILLYLYVPEIHVVSPKNDAGFYQANGYAALSELNAISVGTYLPLDITGQKDNYTQKVQRLLKGQNAFDAAYLYSNINESGKILELSHELPHAVADFMFQKIVAPGMVSNANTQGGETGQMAHLMGCENDGAGPEYDLANRATRSRKFMGFGIKRVEYPETEILEYVTYNFARQAALQLEYNYWQEGIGYGETSVEEAGAGLAGYVHDKKNYPQWLLTDQHLTLARAIIETPESKKWKDISETWESRTQIFADNAQNQADKKSWLRVFSDDCKNYFENMFRTHGVQGFYKLQHQERKAYARFIRRHIEDRIFAEWRSGERSLLNIELLTHHLINSCDERIANFKERIAKKQEEMDKATADIKKANVEWDNIGWLRDAITGKSKKVLSTYKTAKCNFYTAATLVEAYHYAADLLGEIISQLNSMADSIAAYHAMLNDVLEEVTRQAGSKCSPDDADEMTLKKYDRNLVIDFTKACVVNHDTQKANVGSIRQRLVDMLGTDGELSFGALFERVDFDTTVNLIVDICQQNAEAAMINTATEDPTHKMVGVNILEKIKQEYNTDEHLEAFVKSLVASATTFLQYHPQEQAKQFGSAGGGMQSLLQLCIPELPNDPTKFRQKFISAVHNAYPAFDPAQDVAINPKENQIVVVAAKSGFPLRYVANVSTLKQKYENLLSAPEQDLNKMVLHTETLSTDELPPLYELETFEIEQMIKGPVLLGYALDLIKQCTDPTTGHKYDALKVKDVLGDNWEEIGPDILTVTSTLAKNYAKAMLLKKEVYAALQTEARSNDQKEVVRNKLVDLIKTRILPAVENNPNNPIYKEYHQLCIELFESELKDL
jgi:hypothetical protein